MSGPRVSRRRFAGLCGALLLVARSPWCAAAQAHGGTWRTATAAELEAALPARAPVEKERIETEMRTATGIIDDRGRIIAAVVLITAGYAADGKYSHFLTVGNALTVGDRTLLPGAYVVGWTRADDGLTVRFFEANSGAEVGSALARPLPGVKRVESFRIWPPADRSVIQIGRYMLPYTLGR